ncbi:hypothetical protein [Streptomyces sp. NRRL F-525]|uniref:hypothetical protein n=1 Tax=Streptomyces sp. NRRL F-525 TaxID=1463861 RepID=UPI00131D50BC|nr:hypothetical protein [Streptomyces sp. NRRL F-525]
MTRPAPLTDEARALLVTELRHGRAPDEAARGLGLDLSDVWIAARTDPRLTVALAGRDPNAAEEAGLALFTGSDSSCSRVWEAPRSTVG